MSKKQRISNIVERAFLANTSIGQTNITKHDILLMAQSFDPSIQDGFNTGFGISDLRYHNYMVEVGKRGNAKLYQRIM